MLMCDNDRCRFNNDRGVFAREGVLRRQDVPEREVEQLRRNDAQQKRRREATGQESEMKKNLPIS